MVDLDGRKGEYIIDEQEDGTLKRRERTENDGGEDIHTIFFRNGKSLTHNVKANTFAWSDSKVVKEKVESYIDQPNNIFRVTNKSVSVNVGGSLGGGIGGGLGIVYDNAGDWKFYGQFDAKIGFGGGVGLNVSDIVASQGEPFTFKMFEGKGIEHRLGLGPFAVSKGGDVESEVPAKDQFLNFGNRYRTGGVGTDVGAFRFKPKLKMKLSVELTTNFTSTTVF